MTVSRRSYIVTDATGMLVASGDRLNDFSVPGASNAIDWGRGSPPFRVFARDPLAMWGLIGTSDAMSFIDTGIAPNSAIIPDPALYNGNDGAA